MAELRARSGITRESLLRLAQSRGYQAHERRTDIAEVLTGVQNGHCSELFACGTVAIVSPIAVLVDFDGHEYEPLQTDVVAKSLREMLLAIQERRAPGPFGWTREVDAAA